MQQRAPRRQATELATTEKIHLLLPSTRKPQHCFWFQTLKDCRQFSLACLPAAHTELFGDRAAIYLQLHWQGQHKKQRGERCPESFAPARKMGGELNCPMSVSKDSGFCSKETLQRSWADTVFLQNNHHGP